jgi:hypothetical protein
MGGSLATMIKLACAVILAVAVSVIAVLLFTGSADSAKNVQTDIAGNTSELQDQRYVIYDNTQVTGAQVVSALRRFEREAKDGKFAVKVATGKNTSGTWYYTSFINKTLANSTTRSIAGITSTTSYDYINPAGMFDSVIHRDDNGVIRAVEFTQVNN